MASYKGVVPDLKDVNVWTPVDHTEEVSASTISHLLDAEGNFGSGVDEVETSYEVTYGVMMDGEVCTQMDRVAANGNQFQDFKLLSKDADIRFDDNGAYDYATASVDVYIPSSNDFSVLTNQVEVILADASELSEFWTDWELLTTTSDIELDKWVTITLDFSTPDGTTGMDMTDPEAAAGVRDNIDMIILRLGGSAHEAGGTFYVKDFKFIQ